MAFCSPHVSWLYRLSGSFTWQSNLPIAEDLAFKDKAGKVRRVTRRSRKQQGSKLAL